MSFLCTFLSNTNNFSTDLFDPLIGLTYTITVGQSGPGNNGNEGVLQTLHIFRN